MYTIADCQKEVTAEAKKMSNKFKGLFEVDELVDQIWLRDLERGNRKFPNKGLIKRYVNFIIIDYIRSVLRKKTERRKYIFNNYGVFNDDDDFFEKVLSEETPIEDYDNKEEKNFLMGLVNATLKYMSKEQRDSITSYFLYGNSMAEVGEFLGLHIETVRYRIRTGINMIRKVIKLVCNDKFDELYKGV